MRHREHSALLVREHDVLLAELVLVQAAFVLSTLA